MEIAAAGLDLSQCKTPADLRKAAAALAKHEQKRKAEADPELEARKQEANDLVAPTSRSCEHDFQNTIKILRLRICGSAIPAVPMLFLGFLGRDSGVCDSNLVRSCV